MPANNARYKIIYGCFLLVLAAFGSGYSLLHAWLWLRKPDAAPSLALTHWILPAILAIVLYVVFLRKRFHLLQMESPPKRGQYHKRKTQRKFDKADFSIVVIPLLAAPVIAAQFLLVDLTGKRQVLDTPGDISRYPGARYYELRRYEADLQHLFWSHFPESIKSGTRHEVVIAVPLYAPGQLPPPDAINPPSALWLCRRYNYYTVDKDTKEQQDTLVRRFIASTVNQIRQQGIEPFTYLRRPDNDEEGEQFEHTIKEVTAEKGLPAQVLMPVYEPFTERYTWSLQATWIATAASCLIILLVVVFATDDGEAWQRWKAERDYPKRFKR